MTQKSVFRLERKLPIIDDRRLRKLVRININTDQLAIVDYRGFGQAENPIFESRSEYMEKIVMIKLPLLAQAIDIGSMPVYFILLFFVAVVFIAFSAKYIGLWFQAIVSGTPISLINIIGMSMRKIPPRLIVMARITAFKAGLKNLTVNDLETHYLAGGHVNDIVRAMIAADKANIPLNWREATAIDLAGRDLFEAVKTSVNPKVIDCPDKGHYILAVAKNGIELKVRARVTVRTNIKQLVGGATEETVIARVGEGIVNAIGDSDTHQLVLAAPQRISKLVLEKGLDAQTAFEILSIDIADLSIGDNIGARLRADQAEADMRVARATAEERRAMAVALEQENVAKIREAEAQVPLALSEAFRRGQLGVIDYQRYLNLKADTQMREAIATAGESSSNGS